MPRNQHDGKDSVDDVLSSDQLAEFKRQQEREEIREGCRIWDNAHGHAGRAPLASDNPF